MMDELVRKEYTEYSYYVRGKLLNKLTLLEVAIDTHLAHYFTNTPSKIDELVALVFTPRISLDNKIQILNYFINDRHKKFYSDHPRHTNEFKEIIEKRNVLAHYPVKFSKGILENFKTQKAVCFAKFKNTKKGTSKKSPVELYSEVVFTELYTNDLIKLIEKYTNDILDLPFTV